MIEAWFDGGCGPTNPGGYATWGYVIKQDGKLLDRACGTIGYGQGMTNNVAEHGAAFSVLLFLINRGLQRERILVRGDSLMVIRQLRKEMRGSKKRPYFYLYQKSLKALAAFKSIAFEWIPREENWEADELATEARMMAMGPKMVSVALEVAA